MNKASMPSSASRFDENSKAASSIRQWREYCAELLEDRRLLVEDLAALAQCAEEVESLAGNALRNNGATADATEAARSTKDVDMTEKENNEASLRTEKEIIQQKYAEVRKLYAGSRRNNELLQDEVEKLRSEVRQLSKQGMSRFSDERDRTHYQLGQSIESLGEDLKRQRETTGQLLAVLQKSKQPRTEEAAVHKSSAVLVYRQVCNIGLGNPKAHQSSADSKLQDHFDVQVKLEKERYAESDCNDKDSNETVEALRQKIEEIQKKADDKLSEMKKIKDEYGQKMMVYFRKFSALKDENQYLYRKWIQSTQESDNQERVSKLRVQNRSLLAENYRLKDDKEQLLNLVEKLEGKIATFDQAKSSSMNVDEK